MSTAPAAIPASKKDDPEIRIISHSNLFYWWPVWLVGFMLAGLTIVDQQRLAIVPADTKAEKQRTVQGTDGPRDVLILPASKDVGDEFVDPRIRIASHKSYGVLFATVLLLVIFITNVPLRGLWSVIVIGAILALTVIFYLAGWWNKIIDSIDLLQIYINFAGYLVISGVLFVLWLVIMLFFDPQVYMLFRPGQLRVRQEIGDSEQVYDTMGMVIEKQRNDLFRHWILGLGSGDLIVKTSGAHQHHFPLPNVLFVGRKLRQIEEMMREKTITTN